MDQLKDILNKVPLTLVVFLVLAYHGYLYWEFISAPESELVSTQTRSQQLEASNQALDKKIKDAEEFYKNLDKKREEIRALAVELDDMKATLSEEIDIADFIRMVVTEAKKVGLSVKSIKPTVMNQRDFYDEQVFELSFRGVYVQLFVFLERLAKANRIVRMDDFKLKRAGPSTAPYVELEGTVFLKAYRYRGSRADEIARAASKGGA